MSVAGLLLLTVGGIGLLAVPALFAPMLAVGIGAGLWGIYRGHTFERENAVRREREHRQVVRSGDQFWLDVNSAYPGWVISATHDESGLDYKFCVRQADPAAEARIRRIGWGRGFDVSVVVGPDLAEGADLVDREPAPS